MTVRQFDELQTRVIASGHMALVARPTYRPRGSTTKRTKIRLGGDQTGYVGRGSVAGYRNMVFLTVEQGGRHHGGAFEQRRASMVIKAVRPLYHGDERLFLQRGSQFFHDWPVYMRIYKENASKEALKVFGNVTAQAASAGTAEVRYSVCDIDFFEQQEALPKDS